MQVQEMISNAARQSDRHDRIIAATLRCIERLGSQRTSMTDIAKEAGIARRTLYRAFEDRGALFEAILTRRYLEKLGRLAEHLECYESLADALVQGGMWALNLGWSDEILVEIIARGMNHSIEMFILTTNAELRAMHQLIWRPLFAKARASGELVSDLPDERLITGVSSILNLVLLRSDLTLDEREAFLRDFLVRSILGVVPTVKRKRMRARRR